MVRKLTNILQVHQATPSRKKVLLFGTLAGEWVKEAIQRRRETR